MKSHESTSSGAAALLQHLEARSAEMVAALRQIVEMESPSHNKAAVDKLGEHLAAQFAARGGKVTRHKAAAFGDHVQADFSGGSAKPVLLLGHFDTVWEVGTLAKMPVEEKGGRLHGPGVFDMKAGIVQILFALDALRAVRGGLPRPVSVLLVTDEEVGSESSRPVTEALAKKSAAVLIPEPSSGKDGALKTARKGVGDYQIKVTGVPSHAGLDFEKGQSAITELARQILAIGKFTDLKRGLTVNPGVIRGGTRTNVVAAEASVEVDVRIAKAKDAAYIEKKFRGLKPFNRKCKVEVIGGINRPPMERTTGVAALFGTAQEVGRELGIKLREIAVGGGSDGNFTAGLGIPTLDGLGGVGDGAHAAHEHVVVAELARRAALLARMIERV
jgi:glutamate carboxypeptidase